MFFPEVLFCIFGIDWVNYLYDEKIALSAV